MNISSVITDKTHPIEMTCIFIYAVIFAPFLALFLAPFLFMILGPVLFFFYCYTHVHYHIPGFLISYIIVIPAAMAIVILSAKNIHYEFNEQFVIYRKGIISKSERHIPYSKIQHVILSQGLISRRLGLATISISTAAEGGTISNEIDVPCLLYKNALEVKDLVLSRYKANSANTDGLSGL